jgi:hypothetical protein
MPPILPLPLGTLVLAKPFTPISAGNILIIIDAWPSSITDQQPLYKLLTTDGSITFLLHGEIRPF